MLLFVVLILSSLNTPISVSATDKSLFITGLWVRPVF